MAEQHNPTAIAWAQRMMKNCTLVQGSGIRGNEATLVWTMRAISKISNGMQYIVYPYLDTN